MKKQILSFLSISFSVLLIAQNTPVNDPVIMTVDGKGVKKSEFEYIYKKNNTDESIDKKSLEEYVELFKNFKLKVVEAESLGLDTLTDFRNELKDYRSELVKSYVDNTLVNEKLIRQEYERMREDLEISHILITFNDQDFDQANFKNQKVYPADTLAVYKKALQIRKRLLQKGEDFKKVATEVSKDKRSVAGDNPGYLGWFTALRLMPDLEDGAYNTPVGQVSMPIRTQFGYHLVKVLKRQADPGEVRVAHILIDCPKDADTVRVTDAQAKADEIYAEVLRGEDFGELAKKYSADKGSAAKNGELPWFGYGRMVVEFETAAFGLKVGMVSPPVRSQFGYHIIKLLEKRDLAPLEEKRVSILSVLRENGRHTELVEPRLEKMKEENGFSLNKDVFQELQQAANTEYPVDATFLSKFENNNNTLFLTGSTAYTVSQFVKFIRETDAPPFVVSTDLLNERLQGFELDCLTEEVERQLEVKNLEFRNLLQEYRDGILLYNIMNSEVWEKANQDSEGLKVFFDQHKADYAWDQPHYKGYIVLCKDSKVKKKMQKEISKMAPAEAAVYLNQNYIVGDVVQVQLEKGLFIKGDNPFVDEAVFKTGKAECPKDYSDFFVMGELLTIPNDYADVKGLVVTDYQAYLEKMWIEYLNKKYPVVINKDVVNTIK